MGRQMDKKTGCTALRDRRQETKKTKDKKQKTRDKRQETRDKRQETKVIV